jgi:hypothetical protein
LILLCLGLLSSCASDAQDRPVTLSLANAGPEPLRCRLMFGHWVDRDLGALAPGASTDVAMTQAASDGALYVLRADGERKMMIETIDAPNRAIGWRVSGRSISRRSAPGGCRQSRRAAPLPADGGRVACRLDRID